MKVGSIGGRGKNRPVQGKAPPGGPCREMAVPSGRVVVENLKKSDRGIIHVGQPVISRRQDRVRYLKDVPSRGQCLGVGLGEQRPHRIGKILVDGDLGQVARVRGLARKR